MYDDIGGKIKTLAIWLVVIGSIASVVLGLYTLYTNSNLFFIAILEIVLYPLLLWISSWLLYGFGELIENTSIIAGNTYCSKSNLEYEKIKKIPLE